MSDTPKWIMDAARAILGYSDATCGDFDDGDLPNIADHIAKHSPCEKLVEALDELTNRLDLIYGWKGGIPCEELRVECSNKNAKAALAIARGEKC